MFSTLLNIIKTPFSAIGGFFEGFSDIFGDWWGWGAVGGAMLGAFGVFSGLAVSGGAGGLLGGALIGVGAVAGLGVIKGLFSGLWDGGSTLFAGSGTSPAPAAAPRAPAKGGDEIEAQITPDARNKEQKQRS